MRRGVLPLQLAPVFRLKPFPLKGYGRSTQLDGAIVLAMSNNKSGQSGLAAQSLWAVNQKGGQQNGAVIQMVQFRWCSSQNFSAQVGGYC